MCHWLIKKRHKLPYYLITLECECSRDPLLTFMAAPLSIQMYRNIQLKSAHHAVTSEQLNYHSKVSEEELHKFLKRGPIDPQKVGEEFDTYADAALAVAAVVAFRSLLCRKLCTLYIAMHCFSVFYYLEPKEEGAKKSQLFIHMLENMFGESA